ncbi:MAG: hypothetical protein KF874_00500 [Rhizobiaceae bacterium]|nr:hypothetical protein [Rhizobiaceae bacterium]
MADGTDFVIAFSWQDERFAASLNGVAAVVDEIGGSVPSGSTRWSASPSDAWGGTIRSERSQVRALPGSPKFQKIMSAFESA